MTEIRALSRLLHSIWSPRLNVSVHAGMVIHWSAKRPQCHQMVSMRPLSTSILIIKVSCACAHECSLYVWKLTDCSCFVDCGGLLSLHRFLSFLSCTLLRCASIGDGCESPHSPRFLVLRFIGGFDVDFYRVIGLAVLMKAVWTFTASLLAGTSHIGLC